MTNEVYDVLCYVMLCILIQTSCSTCPKKNY